MNTQIETVRREIFDLLSRFIEATEQRLTDPAIAPGKRTLDAMHGFALEFARTEATARCLETGIAIDPPDEEQDCYEAEQLVHRLELQQ